MAADLDLTTLRMEYARGGLDLPDLAPDPVSMFRRWLDESIEAGVHEPNAMVLATVGADGRPSSRMVLLKGLDERGFVFFTNAASRKGQDLAQQPQCALLFPWHVLERQVRVEGAATPLGEDEVAAYFAARPRGAQIGAWASPQSDVVSSRAELTKRYARVEDEYADAEVPVPPTWGGYRVSAESVEFWQGRPGRMHDRLVYRRDGQDWTTERLAP